MMQYGSKCNKFAIGLLVVLLAAILCNFFLAFSYAVSQYQALSGITAELIRQNPEQEPAIVKSIKQSQPGVDYLEKYGYTVLSFMAPFSKTAILAAVFGVFFLALLLYLTVFFQKKRIKGRIFEISSYLAKVNLGKDTSLFAKTNDEFSVLEDEIYKTVTELKTTKEAAVKERRNFAESLVNIAHQIKTPLTAISIHCQLYEKQSKDFSVAQICKQQEKITALADALLMLSKLDSGVVALKAEPVNVYSALSLSLDALCERLDEKQMQVTLPNHSDISFVGDMDWSVEAFVNIIKNCIEHSEEYGVLQIDYSRNPLYTQICVKDSGRGFDLADLARIFKRFYQGSYRANQGFGIGLSLAKAIIEAQNGFISASNNPDGGACFTIRFYS
ncbi:MAG: HAMP domain-containing histidine kinase [Oscillospiraceae bacterium]|jgi:signal transduction histidine kinase|nr:HAMP domain-containing histidine kinase [Oscillospiraceae bacterium]